MKFLVAILSVVLLLSCGPTYSDEEKSTFDDQIEKYLKANSKECERSSSGLYYKIIEQGEGRKIKYSDKVAFTYRGELLDGTVFDNQTKPVEFDVSVLIAAWKEIMLELNEGGKAFLIAPPQLGYGTHQLDDIPPNSILIFTMEVKEVK